MIQFYAPDILTTGMLTESDSAHAVRVLRLAEGAKLQVVDGLGNSYQCRLVAAHPKRAAVEIEQATQLTPTWCGNITLAVAPTKHLDRMEWMVEKMTEMGINRIVPVLCQRSERKELKTERLVKTAISAMKQSLKARLPIIDPLTPLSAFLKGLPAQAHKYVAYCDASTPRRELAQLYCPGSDSVILIGPEGDFSPQEIESALQTGFQAVTLGQERLRTETAAIYGCALCHAIEQREQNPTHS